LKSIIESIYVAQSGNRWEGVEEGGESNVLLPSFLSQNACGLGGPERGNLSKKKRIRYTIPTIWL
jgi:hypothetical protein